MFYELINLVFFWILEINQRFKQEYTCDLTSYILYVEPIRSSNWRINASNWNPTQFIQKKFPRWQSPIFLKWSRNLNETFGTLPFIYTQEYWSGLPCPPPGDLPDPRIKPTSLYISCTGRWVLYHYRHLGSPYTYIWWLSGVQTGG